MSPTLKDGDYAIIKKPGSLRPGFVYLIDHSDLGRIIKRLDRVENNYATFVGDNSGSTPQALIGSVEISRITGLVWLRLSPDGIKRL